MRIDGRQKSFAIEAECINHSKRFPSQRDFLSEKEGFHQVDHFVSHHGSAFNRKAAPVVNYLASIGTTRLVLRQPRATQLYSASW